MNGPSEKDGWLRPALLTLSAILLGIAMNVEEGMYHPAAVALLAGAIASCVCAVTLRSNLARTKWQANAPTVLLALGILVQLHLLFWGRPGTWKNVDWRDPSTAVGPLSMTGKLPWPAVVRDLLDEQTDLFAEIADRPRDATGKQRHRILAIDAHLNTTGLQFFVALIAAIVVIYLASRGRPRWFVPVFLALFCVTGFWVVWRTPNPHIDVFVFQQESSAALLSGKNPYAIDFPNIYGSGSYVYAADLEQGDRVKFGFPYPPAGLLMALPGYAIGGDHRYAQVVALTLSGALLAYCRKGIVPKLAAVLLLTTPRIVMITECAWTEPFVVLGLSATVFAACRYPKLTPYLFGVFAAIKQYSVFALPLVPLLLPRPASARGIMAFLVKAGIVTAILSAPLIFWDFPAFWWSAGTLQFKQPFRSDSLSFPALLSHLGQPDLALLVSKLAFLLVLPAIALALYKLPRTPGGFATALAFTYFIFFSLSKQAFCNYYFFVLGALCCAIATSSGIVEEVEATPEEENAAAELAALGTPPTIDS